MQPKHTRNIVLEAYAWQRPPTLYPPSEAKRRFVIDARHVRTLKTTVKFEVGRVDTH